MGDTASEFDGTAIGGPTWVVGVALAPAGPNVAPEFSTDITDQTANEGAVISLDADATDADGDIADLLGDRPAVWLSHQRHQRVRHRARSRPAARAVTSSRSPCPTAS